jgi:oxygen-independent coproporphyrinogen-3 oxidase
MPLHSQASPLWGLYIHIPFCSELCHYCDFAKTARWDEATVSQYFSVLHQHLADWLTHVVVPRGVRFVSLYLGGGTPGLFTREYETLFALMAPYLLPSAEITLEANPNNLTPQSLAHWRGLGVNRVSAGVQSFEEKGLRFLTRDHTPLQLQQTLSLLPQYFSSYNIDLIYSWPGQSLTSWKQDLEKAAALSPAHLSLYNLTYAPQTPIGRAHERKKIQSPPDESQAEFYEVAQSFLATKGYLQEEISNWYRPGFEAKHNALYWQDVAYLALGAGAWGYMPDETPWGIRYQYPKGLRAFLSMPAPLFQQTTLASAQPALLIETQRDAESWLLEYVGAALRSMYGVDLSRIARKTQRNFVPTPWVQHGLDTGMLTLSTEGILRLAPQEWFRETAWCGAVLSSLV